MKPINVVKMKNKRLPDVCRYRPLLPEDKRKTASNMIDG